MRDGGDGRGVVVRGCGWVNRGRKGDGGGTEMSRTKIYG